MKTLLTILLLVSSLPIIAQTSDEKEKFMNSNNPIISIDTKKKEAIGGNLHREGKVYCTQAIEAADHDWPNLADLKIVLVAFADRIAKTMTMNLNF